MNQLATDIVSCLHCGLPSPEGAEFCCSGCKTVYKTINSLGLGEFYRFRDVAVLRPATPATPKGDSFNYFDSPTFSGSSVRQIDPTTCEVTLILDGIHCAGCIWLLEKLPAIVSGVIQASVNLTRGEITVRYDADKVKLSAIARMLDTLGYVPRLSSSPSDLEESKKRENRRSLIRIGVAGFSSMNTMMLAASLYQGLFTGIPENYASYFRWVSLVLALPAVCFSAIPFYRTAWASLKVRSLHIDLPIAIGVVGAFILSVVNTFLESSAIYFDSISTLILLLLSGRFIQSRAMERAREASSRSWDLIPTTARRRKGGEFEEVPSKYLEIGDEIEIRSGERVPADGVVIAGISAIDTSVLTGESVPRGVEPSVSVYGGTLNIEGPLSVRVTASGAESRMGKILAEVERFAERRGPFLTLVNRASGYFVGAIILAAIGTFVGWYLHSGITAAVDNALAILVVTCPCALGMAAPAAMSVALGQAARQGILVKGGEALEKIGTLKSVAFDKTGTLTEGSPTVVEVHYTNGATPDVNSWIKSLLETTPHHPIARAILSSEKVPGRSINVASTKFVPGRGVEGKLESGATVRVGSLKWISATGEAAKQFKEVLSSVTSKGYSVLAAENDGKVCALFLLTDTLRPEAPRIIHKLRTKGISLCILSGDADAAVKTVGNSLGFSTDELFSGIFPDEKAEILSRKPKPSAMVGDGVNDALAFNAASVGIALRGGMQTLVEVADVVILRGELSGVEKLFNGAERVMRVIHRNLFISAFYNIVGAGAAMMGLINPFVAALLMPISSISVIVSSVTAKTFSRER